MVDLAWSLGVIAFGVVVLTYFSSAPRRDRFLDQASRSRTSVGLDSNRSGQKIAVFGLMVIAAFCVWLGVARLLGWT